MTDLLTIQPPVRGVRSAPLSPEVVKPKILTIDIETSPNLAHVWSLWDQNVGLTQLMETGEMMSFAAKWYGQPDVMFYSNHHDGHETMVRRAFELQSEADVLVHFNGRSFDVKHLHREYLLGGYGPPAPHKDVDLLLIAKATFKFVSNKLDHLADQTGLGRKTQHTGHQLWVDCLKGDKDAWALMREYNIHDVVLTEQLYDIFRPWIRTHPHLGELAAPTKMSCNHCGSTDLRRDGVHQAVLLTYERFQCNSCLGWVRAGKGTRIASARGI